MNAQLELIDSLLTKLIQQVPALVALIWIVWQFLRSMSQRDRDFLSSQHKLNQEMHDLAELIKQLCFSVEQKNKDVCQFHDRFQNSLDRIESTVIKECKE